MNKNFILLDKNSNLQKTANIIVKFKFEERDYLVYSIDENEQNCQIFVSKIIINSEGKHFIENILQDEKNKLNNIVYNIVILAPTEALKGSNFDILSQNLQDKFSVKLFPSETITEIQEYYRNCSIAITSKILAENAIKFYDENLNNNTEDSLSKLPTWTAPIETTVPDSVDTIAVNNKEDLTTSNEVSQSMILDTINLQSSPVTTIPNEKEEIVSLSEPNNSVSIVPAATMMEEKVTPNSLNQRIAIISDPSLGFGGTKTDTEENKKAGFASTKYVIIGSICLILAVAVIIIAYLLISNMK